MANVSRSQSLPYPISSIPRPNLIGQPWSNETQYDQSANLGHKTRVFPFKHHLSNYHSSPSVTKNISKNLYKRISTSVSTSTELNKLSAERLRKARMEEVQIASQQRRRLTSIHSNSTPEKSNESINPWSLLPANPTTWSPSDLSIYLSHVLNLGPARLVADVRAYVIGAGLGGRQFLKMTTSEFQNTGLNKKWVKMMVVAKNNLRFECKRSRPETGFNQDWTEEEEEANENLDPQDRKSKLLDHRRQLSGTIPVGQVHALIQQTCREKDNQENVFFAEHLNKRSSFELPLASDAISRLSSRRCSIASSIESFSSVLSTDEIDLTSPILVRPENLIIGDQSVEWDESSTIFRSPSPLGMNDRILNPHFIDNTRASETTIKETRSEPEITSPFEENRGGSSTITIKPSAIRTNLSTHDLDTASVCHSTNLVVDLILDNKSSEISIKESSIVPTNLEIATSSPSPATEKDQTKFPPMGDKPLTLKILRPNSPSTNNTNSIFGSYMTELFSSASYDSKDTENGIITLEGQSSEITSDDTCLMVSEIASTSPNPIFKKQGGSSTLTIKPFIPKSSLSSEDFTCAIVKIQDTGSVEEDQSIEWDLGRSPISFRSSRINERVMIPINAENFIKSDNDTVKSDTRASKITIDQTPSVLRYLQLTAMNSPTVENQSLSPAMKFKGLESRSAYSTPIVEFDYNTHSSKFECLSNNSTKLSPIPSQNPYMIQVKDEDVIEKRKSIDLDDHERKDECILIKELLADTEELLNTPQRKPRLERQRRPNNLRHYSSDDSITVSASKLKAMERQMFEIENRLQRSKSRDFSSIKSLRDVSISQFDKSDVIADDPSSWKELCGYLIMATLGLGIVAGKVFASKALGWKKL
ncbi:hypothetical protein CROQUDRAFT_665956 [Cronartium quercuum f. sp. fusiforme G11]|uniref:Uncharacterized protein n=1 Tax=Cronartium quercuum f. sp. fusiforme G11 TaxID=708437 RepID=A0A9P6N9R3_9BASI|nr:hypothetical protein CROQUDRAFT_665956 [Cronartium quercuum f. sp. fusiforme G11]